jgi:hypothetical protein
MKVNERIYFISKLKNYMDEENLVSMEVNLPHQSMIELTNQLGQLQGKELENYILNREYLQIKFLLKITVILVNFLAPLAVVNILVQPKYFFLLEYCSLFG